MNAYESTLSLWPVPYESIYVETDYGTTHVIRSGPANGEPIILLNGFGFSATMWYPNIKTLSADYQVYAVDVMGNLTVVRLKLISVRKRLCELAESAVRWAEYRAGNFYWTF